MKRKITLRHGASGGPKHDRALAGIDTPLAITLVLAYAAAGLAFWSGAHWTAALALLPGIGTLALPAISLLLLAVALRKQR